jgi:hypothetical protein
VFGQYTKYRFAQAIMQANDFNHRVLGIGYQRANGPYVWWGNVYHGGEQDVGGRPSGANRFSGLRAGGGLTAGSLGWYASAGAQASSYDTVHSSFLRKRADRQYDMTVGTDWHWRTNWTLSPQLKYWRNNSNMEVYAYSRTDVSLTVRRDFK